MHTHTHAGVSLSFCHGAIILWQILCFGLYLWTYGCICARRLLCFCVRFRRPVVCGSSSGLGSQKEAVRHVPGLCGQWFGLPPVSQMAGVSVPFSFSSYLVLFHHKLPLSLSPLAPPYTHTHTHTSLMKTFPHVNRDVRIGLESLKNMSLWSWNAYDGCKYAIEEALKTPLASSIGCLSKTMAHYFSSIVF